VRRPLGSRGKSKYRFCEKGNQGGTVSHSWPCSGAVSPPTLCGRTCRRKAVGGSSTWEGSADLRRGRKKEHYHNKNDLGGGKKNKRINTLEVSILNG